MEGEMTNTRFTCLWEVTYNISTSQFSVVLQADSATDAILVVEKKLLDSDKGLVVKCERILHSSTILVNNIV